MKSITTKPPKSRSLNCLATSTAASKFVFNAVFSIFLSDVFLPEFTSIATSASVVLITIDPPDSNLTDKLNKSFICASILFSINNELFLPLNNLIFLLLEGTISFVIFLPNHNHFYHPPILLPLHL